MRSVSISKHYDNHLRVGLPASREEVVTTAVGGVTNSSNVKPQDDLSHANGCEFVEEASDCCNTGDESPVSQTLESMCPEPSSARSEGCPAEANPPGATVTWQC